MTNTYNKAFTVGITNDAHIAEDGSRVSLEFSMVLLRDESGSMQGVASIMREVTERWKREKELKERLSACEARLASTPV